MHLIGEMPDDDRSGPADAALWGLYEVRSNSPGMTDTRSECVSYFEQAGFTNIQVFEFIPEILVRACVSNQARVCSHKGSVVFFVS